MGTFGDINISLLYTFGNESVWREYYNRREGGILYVGIDNDKVNLEITEEGPGGGQNTPRLGISLSYGWKVLVGDSLGP